MKKDKKMVENKPNLELYTKSIYLIIFGVSLLTILSCRNKISDESLLLLILLIGGFLFYILWEAKSRYIISYVVSIIPLVALPIDFNGLKNDINKNFRIKK